ncbi:hypothetical protein JHW43_005693 [Diplocarpon mali]|nr:hypothetical protein JHW43_005693 [Diplocarpon mali]
MYCAQVNAKQADARQVDARQVDARQAETRHRGGPSGAAGTRLHGRGADPDPGPTPTRETQTSPGADQSRAPRPGRALCCLRSPPTLGQPPGPGPASRLSPRQLEADDPTPVGLAARHRIPPGPGSSPDARRPRYPTTWAGSSPPLPAPSDPDPSPLPRASPSSFPGVSRSAHGCRSWEGDGAHLSGLKVRARGEAKADADCAVPLRGALRPPRPKSCPQTWNNRGEHATEERCWGRVRSGSATRQRWEEVANPVKQIVHALFCSALLGLEQTQPARVS